MWRRVDLLWTEVSREHIASIFRVEKPASEEPTWAGSCSTDWDVTVREVSAVASVAGWHFARSCRSPILGCSLVFPTVSWPVLYSPSGVSVCGSWVQGLSDSLHLYSWYVTRRRRHILSTTSAEHLVQKLSGVAKKKKNRKFHDRLFFQSFHSQNS
jgi:hypothetical protein